MPPPSPSRYVTGGAPQAPSGSSTAFVRPHALCVSKRQLEQTEFHNRHVGEFVSFWSQRAVEAANMPDDRVRALELRPRAVKRIMRAAVEETVSEHRKDLLQGDAAARGSVVHHGAPSSFSRARGEGAAGSSLHPGRDGSGTLLRAANVRVQEGMDSRTGEAEQQRIRNQGVDTSGEAFLIKDEACFVMARACELFAMDVAKRSELVMEDRGVTKGETFKHKRGEKRGFKHSQLRPHDVQTAIDSTDYCDFLIDLVHPPTSEA